MATTATTTFIEKTQTLNFMTMTKLSSLRVDRWGFNKNLVFPDLDKSIFYDLLGLHEEDFHLYIMDTVVRHYHKPITDSERDKAGIALWFLRKDQTTKHKLSDIKRANVEVVDVVFDYKDDNSGYYNSSSSHFAVAIKHGDKVIPIKASFLVCEKLFGLKITEDLKFEIDGRTFGQGDLVKLLKQQWCFWDDRGYKRNYRPFDFIIETYNNIAQNLSMRDAGNIHRFLVGAKEVCGRKPVQPHPKAGIAKVFNKLVPLCTECADLYPESYMWFRSFVNNAKKTVDSVKLSTVFNAMFSKVETVEQFAAALHPLVTRKDRLSFEGSVKDLPEYKVQRKKVLKSQSGRAFSKLMQEYEFLSLDEKEYPVTTKAIQEGDLPISIFFRKKEQYFLLNDNFPLWEEMLKKHYKIAIAIAKHAAKRTTYEKDVMSYFYFVLYALPTFLKKYTKRKWTCLPKLVESESELAPPEAGEGGISRKRSALTPIVDNIDATVVVPYASLAIPGRQTTYCYSHTYNVVDDGFAFNGNTAMSGLEKKLNSRDDYGLMFYTLTGSFQGRGYPTFLIIFERLVSDDPKTKGKVRTRVHFHRTHPCRSKDGDYNPIHNWIKQCYNWMAGNVNASRIINQQGDLIFVQDMQEDREYPTTVDFYDKHVFETSVKFAPYEKKKKDNILGWISLEEQTILNHAEHMSITLPAGNYEIRQCRSWEANPKGVWSLRID